jgi:hypothetical protein
VRARELPPRLGITAAEDSGGGKGTSGDKIVNVLWLQEAAVWLRWHAAGAGLSWGKAGVAGKQSAAARRGRRSGAAAEEAEEMAGFRLGLSTASGGQRMAQTRRLEPDQA